MKKICRVFLISVLASAAALTASAGGDALKSHLMFHENFENGAGKTIKTQGLKFVKSNLGKGVQIKDKAFCAYERKGHFNPQSGTLMFWTKQGSNSDAFFTIGDKWYKGNFFTFRIIESQNAIQAIFKKDGKTIGNANFKNLPPKEDWVHFAATWGNGKIKLYVNGKLKSTGKMESSLKAEEMSKTMWLGTSGEGNAPANSIIDEVKIYDIPLTPTQIASLENPKWAPKKKAPKTIKKKQAKTNYTWKDWNSTPYPEEGKCIKNLYNFAENYITEENFHRFEFKLNKKVSDAWIVFHSYMSEPFDHKIFINNVINFEYPASKGKYDSETLITIPAKGLKKGENVVWLNSQWFALELIVNMTDGSQEIIKAGPGWSSASIKHNGWDKAGYTGPGEEAQYRNGRSGYHLWLNPFLDHVYIGKIELDKLQESPVYKIGDTMDWIVSVPLPFYGTDKPQLSYEIVNCFEKAPAMTGKGEFVEVKNGKAFYRILRKAEKAGAYDICLSFGDKEAMKRREELVIVGPIEQPVAQRADTLIKSMKLELVDEVDCAKDNPGNPVIHGPLPNGAEPEGKIVRNKNGLTYFETGTKSGFLSKPEQTDYAMWKLDAKDLNQWHLVEVDIPEDKDRVQIIAIVHNLTNREYGVESTVEIGEPRPLSGKIYTHRMLFIPKFKDVRIMISPSHRRGAKPYGAAVKAIRFYKIEGGLPKLKLGNSGRIIANYNERADLIGTSHYPASDPFSATLQFKAPRQYRRWYLAIKAHIEYTRFVGQNAVCHGLYQYVREEYPTRPGQTDFIKLMLDMYHANGIDFYCNNEFFTSEKLEGRTLSHKVKKLRVSNEEVADGKETYRLVSNKGMQATGSPLNNPCSPAIKADMLRIVSDIASRYASSPAFKGMMVFAGTMGCATNFRGDDWGYGDTTYNIFKKETRVDAPDFKGKDRFKKRCDWIKENAWHDWVTFRCQKVYELNRAFIDKIKEYSDQSKLIVNICAWPWMDNIGDGTVRDLKKRLIDTGTDVRLFANDPDMIIMHNDWMGQHITKKELFFVEKYNRDKNIWKYVTQDKPCGVFFWTGFYETALYFPREMQNKYWHDNKWHNFMEKRFIGSAGKSGRNYLSAFSNAFAYGNPILFSNRFTDVAEHRGFLTQRAEASQAISYIPKGNYVIQKGSTDEVILKSSGKNAYIVNNIYHPTKVTIELSRSNKAPRLTTAIAGKELDINGIDGGLFTSPTKYECSIEMKPYEILPLTIEGEIKIKSIEYDNVQYDAFKKTAAQNARNRK